MDWQICFLAIGPIEQAKDAYGGNGARLKVEASFRSGRCVRRRHSVARLALMLQERRQVTNEQRARRKQLGTQKPATGDTVRLSTYWENIMHIAEKTVLITGANRGIAIPDDLTDLNKE